MCATRTASFNELLESFLVRESLFLSIILDAFVLFLARLGTQNSLKVRIASVGLVQAIQGFPLKPVRSAALTS